MTSIAKDCIFDFITHGILHRQLDSDLFLGGTVSPDKNMRLLFDGKGTRLDEIEQPVEWMSVAAVSHLGAGALFLASPSVTRLQAIAALELAGEALVSRKQRRVASARRCCWVRGVRDARPKT